MLNATIIKMCFPPVVFVRIVLKVCVVFSNNSQSNEISVYVQGLVQILQSDKDRVEEVINDVTEKWSQSAVNYFNTYLKSDILGHAAKWVIQQFPGLYNPFSGITNNASESINNVLKLHVNGKELPVDALVLSLQFLQYRYFYNIQYSTNY